MSEPSKAIAVRLRAAREAAGYRSAAAAARALGIPYSSYVSHENAASGIRAPSLQRYAAKFGTTVDALLEGEALAPHEGAPTVADALRRADAAVLALTTALADIKTALRGGDDQDH